MNCFFLFSSVIIGLGQCVPLRVSEHEGVFYYVAPTQSLNSCPVNSSCPHGQHCYTMDHLVEHSSEFFSLNHTNLTLMFMCGVHNYTKDLTLQNLYSLVMKGATEFTGNHIINMFLPVKNQVGTQFSKSSCTAIHFFNVIHVTITTLTLQCPSIIVERGFIAIKNTKLYGYAGISEILSSINITGRHSQALLDNCTFKGNCFVVGNLSTNITVSNSTFQSYRHETGSIIVAYSSVITLTGYVNVTDSVTGIHHPGYSSGAAVFLRTTLKDLRSSLDIIASSAVHFVNLTCSNFGAAVYAENGEINIGAKATLIFKHNKASYKGGAVYLMNGIMNVGTGSRVVFAHNSAVTYGGAVFLTNTVMNVKHDANMSFSYNTAYQGGAVALYNATFKLDSSTVLFDNNTAGVQGGAMRFQVGTFYINNHSNVTFIMNSALLQGGAICIFSADQHSIIVDKHAQLIFFNNSAYRGGALYAIPSSFALKVGSHSCVQFINNTATDVGGAVCSESMSVSYSVCVFMVTDYSAHILFSGNYAKHNIGHHMYGASARYDGCNEAVGIADKKGIPYCNSNFHHFNISFHPGLNETLSPVSSSPQRVCLCDFIGRPQCASWSHIFPSVSVYRGETFTLSATVVGCDFGTTIGSVYAQLHFHSSTLSPSQYSQLVNSSETCTSLEYTIYSKKDSEILQLQVHILPINLLVYDYKKKISSGIELYTSNARFGCLTKDFLQTLVLVNITLVAGCPPGFTLSVNNTKCTCYSLLAEIGFQCSIQNKTGSLQWNSTVWVNATFHENQSNGIIYNHFCPLHYCKLGKKAIDIGRDPNKQCASNRTGILCGACMENFSLAIGSSQCIECPNSHNTSLLLFFAPGGILLVLLILALNLTVTQGLINGLIFYANIVWAYKLVLFPLETQSSIVMLFLQAFVAWLNLDFGIETCFFVGLNAYWKTWLQFLFPFYIWAIAGVIIVACRYSSRLTNLIGSRAVPLLATLFLLSYMKLLRTIIDATLVAVIERHPQNTSFVVWYLDGNLRYCQHPHVFLFIAAIATLVFLWLPYTLLLLFVQPLRRVSHLRPLKWINKLAPVYDAYFFPLKDKHQYWFGSMLLIRGILLIILTITSIKNPELNILILLVTMTVLLVYMSVKYVYKQANVRALESAALMNLIVLSAGTLYTWESTESRSMLLKVSIGFTFAKCCIITLWSIIKLCSSANCRCRQKQPAIVIDENTDNDVTHERIEDPELEPLITHKNNGATVTY